MKAARTAALKSLFEAAFVSLSVAAIASLLSEKIEEEVRLGKEVFLRW